MPGACMCLRTNDGNPNLQPHSKIGQKILNTEITRPSILSYVFERYRTVNNTKFPSCQLDSQWARDFDCQCQKDLKGSPRLL